MSYIITAIVSMMFGAGLALLMRNSGNAAAEERAFKDGMERGYSEGYKAGDRDGYRAGIKRMTAMKRVDVAPGPDSIRPEKWAENEKKEAAK